MSNNQYRFVDVLKEGCIFVPNTVSTGNMNASTTIQKLSHNVNLCNVITPTYQVEETINPASKLFTNLFARFNN